MSRSYPRPRRGTPPGTGGRHSAGAGQNVVPMENVKSLFFSSLNGSKLIP